MRWRREYVVLSASSTRSLRFHQVARWTILTALDVATEIVLVCIPVWLVTNNEIKRSKKMIVVFVFSFRLLVAAFSIITTVTYLTYVEHHHDAIAIAPTVAWQEVLLGVSLISASIPCLRSFLWAFMSTGLMTNYGTRTGPAGVLRDVDSSPDNTATATATAGTVHSGENSDRLPCRLRPDDTEYKVKVRTRPHYQRMTTATTGRASRRSAESFETGQWVVNRTREIHVTHS